MNWFAHLSFSQGGALIMAGLVLFCIAGVVLDIRRTNRRHQKYQVPACSASVTRAYLRAVSK